jgi:hypothetical protein
MALELLGSKGIPHLFHHDAESFIWWFLWVCGCSDGSGKEVRVTPYKTWVGLEMLACEGKKAVFLLSADLKDINVSQHHAPNGRFCLILAKLLVQLQAMRPVSPTVDCAAEDKNDMAIFEDLLTRLQKIRAEVKGAPVDDSKTQIYLLTILASLFSLTI